MKSKKLKPDKYFWLADKIDANQEVSRVLKRGLLKSLKKHTRMSRIHRSP